MNALPLLLVGPTLAVLALLYWLLPRNLPRPAARRAYDVAAIIVAAIVAWRLVAMGLAAPSPEHVDAIGHYSGAIWPQVLSILYAYVGFLAVLFAALLLRQWLWGRRRRDANQDR